MVAGRYSPGGESPVSMPAGESGLAQVRRAMHPEQRGAARNRLFSESWQHTDVAGC